MKVVVFLLVFSLLAFLSGIALAHSDTQIIEMTPEGFSPDPVTIDQNSSVIFVNKDSQPRWPASNVHPTHEIYPEFDSREPIKPGASWVFKPERTGTFKYHDHLLPHKRGTLIVEGEQPTKKTLSLFESFTKYFSGLINSIKSALNKAKPHKQVISPQEFIKLSYQGQTQALKDYVKNTPSGMAWKFIVETYKGQAGSSGNIHDLAHLSGSLMYEKGGFKDLGFCSAEFAFGCFHGFLDRAFKDNLDYLSDALDACMKLNTSSGQTSNVSSPISGPIASCIHGIGHGVASFYSTKDVKKSLSACRALVNGKEYCFDGVFMEFVRSAPDSFYKADDPLYPCNQLENEFGYAYSFACGRNQASLLMQRFGKGFGEVAGICLRSESKPFKEACFDSLGFSAASEKEVASIISACKKIEAPEYRIRCLKAAAGELVFQEVPGWQSKAPSVCNGLEQGRGECMEHVSRLIQEYGRKQKVRTLSLGEDINSYASEQLKACYGTGGKEGCYKDTAKAFYDQFGLSKTLGILKANEGKTEVYARCHEVTHYLSRFEYDKQRNIAKVYAQCDSTCHGGCYHGTLEAYLKEKQLQQDSDISQHFPNICGRKSDYQKPLEFNECLHGLGHAAMFVTDMELLESLRLCDTLQGEEPKTRCYSGVFMENSSSSTSFDHKSKYIKTDDPFYPCNSLEEKYQALCWQYQSSYFSILTNQDWSKVAEMCRQTPEAYQDLCFRTIGTNQVGFTQSIDTMKKDCDLMPSVRFQNICVGGVISSFAYRFVGESQKMIDFCSIVNPENQETCFKQLGTSLLDWGNDKTLAQKECQKITNEAGMAWCMDAVKF